MNNWKCEKCNWQGDMPEIYDPYDDGGFEVCPECKEQVILNWNNTQNQLRFLKTLFRVN